MEKNIREAIDRSLKELKNMQAKVDSYIDGLPDDTADIKGATKNALAQINGLLNKAVEQAGDKAEEAPLQAHLGLMEAQDKLESSRAVFEDLVSRSSDESKKLLDEVELKRHLAMMEAKDFWEERGSKLAEEFQASAVTMQSLAEKAMGDMHTAFSQWNEQFKKDK